MDGWDGWVRGREEQLCTLMGICTRYEGKEETTMHATVVVSAHALGGGGDEGAVCARREGVCTRMKVGMGGRGGGRGDDKRAF
jgi:hypothetical protein